jgi:tetratricopeptide (TPR) repeat protein
MTLLVLATSCEKEDSAASAGNDESAPRHHSGAEGFSGEDRRRDRANPDRKQDRARQHEFSKLLESARKSFGTHDISSALTALEEAGDLYEAHPDLLNLRGSCHVELRDFEKALTDFSQALKKMPNSPAIHFNIGEVHFVSRRWDDAIRSFNQAKERSAPESETLRQLIDFKLMLCEAGRGNLIEFEASLMPTLKFRERFYRNTPKWSGHSKRRMMGQPVKLSEPFSSYFQTPKSGHLGMTP